MSRGKKDKVTREDYTPEPTVNGEPIGDNFAKPGDALDNATVDTNVDGIEGETAGLSGESELNNAEDTNEPETTADDGTEGANDDSDEADEADSDEADEADSDESEADSGDESGEDDESDDSEADSDPNATIEESWEHKYETAKASGEPMPDDTGG